MFGAIIGDMVGSIYEFDNHKSKEFPFFGRGCYPTDDSIMTIAVAKAILENDGKVEGLSEKTVEWMQKIGRQYPNCGYGDRFWDWMFDTNPSPYNSYGNGAAMRVSACGWVAKNIEEAKALAFAVTAVSHNHPEGIKGAEAVACVIYLANTGSSMEEIRSFIEENYYELNFTLDEIRPTYEFNETCQETVPQAIEAFLESTSFEDAIRNAISVGGDSDTLAAITGSIAEAYYGIPIDIREQATKQFQSSSFVHYPLATAAKDPDLLTIIETFHKKYGVFVRRKNIRAIFAKESEHAGMTEVGLDMIDPKEVVIVTDAGRGAMGDRGAVELYSIHDENVLYFRDNKLRTRFKLDEFEKHLPEGVRYGNFGVLDYNKELWKIFGGGMGNCFLIQSRYFDELQKRASRSKRRTYRSIVYIAEQLLLEIAKNGDPTGNKQTKPLGMV